jgi:hypothetical protein
MQKDYSRILITGYQIRNIDPGIFHRDHFFIARRIGAGRELQQAKQKN